ncbi:hypothetical protein RBB50_011250 [Rhinocladiella similis]
MVELSFAGQNIAITGGASGIGLATVQALHQLGANVYVADYADKAPENFPSSTERSTVQFFGRCDISRREDCHNFISSIPGRLDGVVNSAGIAKTEGRIATDELWNRTIAVNLTGTWNMSTEAVLRMSKQDVRTSSNGPFVGTTNKSVGQGAIVNISSGAGFRGHPELAAYCASKHGVHGVTKAMSKDWPHIRMNVVAPGVIKTPIIGNTPEVAAKIQEKLEAAGKKMGLPEDVADVVIFLLSDASAWMTGQVLSINGGSD